jgi:hypothetical protein
MPDAHIENDGTLRFDAGYFRSCLPAWRMNPAFVAEHDANDYPCYFSADELAADTRHGGATYGLEYLTRW